MNDVKEYTGIDPAPVPLAPLKVEKKPTKTSFDPYWAVAVGFGTFAAITLKDLPMVKMAQMMVAAKLSMLPVPIVKTLIAVGTVAIPVATLYGAFKLFPKLLDAVQCILGGGYEAARSVLTGVGVVFKNIVPVSKTCFQLSAGTVCPAYAAHLSSKKYKISFEKSALLKGANPPDFVILSYSLHGVLLIAVDGFLALLSISTHSFIPARSVFAIHCGLLTLNTLYVVGRIARERKEKANGATL